MEYPYQLSVLFTEKEMKAIDKAAKEHHVSKTEVVRLAVDSGLSVKREKGKTKKNENYNERRT